MLQAYDVPAILVSADYEILATNQNYTDKFGPIPSTPHPRCFEVSHGYDRPCDQAGEDCPLLAAKQSKQKERVLHIHQTPNGSEHVDVEMIPIFDDKGDLSFFVELLKPVPLASGKTLEQTIIGSSRVFTKMLENATRVADSDVSVVLLGESGTGKELISRLIHLASKRSSQPMVTLECSGLSEALIESELFGHKKGAFTGAHNDRQGLVEHADGGTLFLDEIGDVSLATQVKLLRLIETKTFRRVGGTEVRTSNFRLICATHRNLSSMVEDGTFRLDLYYRINVFPITVPPLSERLEDIPDLVEHLLNTLGRKIHITESALSIIQRHSFKGNIRELRNLLSRATILCDTNLIESRHIQLAVDMEGNDASTYYESTYSNPLKHREAEYLQHLMSKFKGDKKAVAKYAGISLRTLYRKI
jgi:transcriptional regulator with PAS, ATPase and Fis domain